ncbi:type IV pilin protein [Neobacillus vireti]|uniref:type IV pilin protein n=1 Tax=Neobacillus vireti TaxID=220686 RepID=UPI002FFDB121
MLKSLKLKAKEQKGFTLIELLAVIVILGILAAIAIPSISNIIQNSRVDAVKTDALAIMNAGKLYLTQNPEDDSIDYTDLDDFVDNTSLDTSSILITVTSGVLSLDAIGTAGSVTYTISDATFETLNDEAEWEQEPVTNAVTIAP